MPPWGTGTLHTLQNSIPVIDLSSILAELNGPLLLAAQGTVDPELDVNTCRHAWASCHLLHHRAVS